MPASWLYQIGPDGLLVTTEVMARGDATALRTLNRQPLTKLYRANYSRSRRKDAIGHFWADVPPLARIPLVRGRPSPPAWVKNDLLAEVVKPKKNTWDPPKLIERAERSVRATASFARKQMKPGEQTVLVKREGGRLRAWNMKPNPNFDLVVVNRHDRAALLKLLGELDGNASIQRWLDNRTKRAGATAASALHTDYSKWCERHGEVPAGLKGFAQGLVAAGVGKLPRSAGGARYELQLR